MQIELWQLGLGTLGTLMTGALTFVIGMRQAHKEERSDRVKYEADFWERANKESDRYAKRIDDQEIKIDMLSKQRIKDLDACDEQIREVRKKAESENDELRTRLVKLGKVCFEQQEQLDSQQSHLQAVGRRLGPEQGMTGGTRSSDSVISPASVPAVGIIPVIPPGAKFDFHVSGSGKTE